MRYLHRFINPNLESIEEAVTKVPPNYYLHQVVQISPWNLCLIFCTEEFERITVEQTVESLPEDKK